MCVICHKVKPVIEGIPKLDFMEMVDTFEEAVKREVEADEMGPSPTREEIINHPEILWAGIIGNIAAQLMVAYNISPMTMMNAMQTSIQHQLDCSGVLRTIPEPRRVQ